jgi:hypothetical protein
MRGSFLTRTISQKRAQLHKHPADVYRTPFLQWRAANTGTTE